MSQSDTSPDSPGSLVEEFSETDTPWIWSMAVPHGPSHVANTPWTPSVVGGEASPPVDEEELLDEPIDDVPKLLPGWYCNARRSDDGVFVGYCSNRAGKGTDHVGDGRCSFHGGAADNAGRENGNYVHGAYSREFHAALLGFVESEHPGTIEAADSDPVARRRLGRYLASFALEKFARSEDPRHLCEFEMALENFGLLTAAGGE
ncbi:hypothetical protein [Halovivax cerinus]|uniref:Uncharacterized protein n=1 Tax=Halovivax cerinus TaxID=1487865 RepID=A0ABD5NL47_9EURY|nr:hypothetical protein [Halovivax cerinus]